MNRISLPGKRSTHNVILCAALLLSFVCSVTAQQNLVYVETNTGTCPTCRANQNSILILVNDGTGQLTFLGAPTKIRGTGLYDAAPGTDFDADQQLIANAAGSLMFAVNMHSNTIAVLNINADGTLTPVAGSPFASNGTQPASLSLLDGGLPDGSSLLIAANKDDDPTQTQTAPNYSTFLVASDGSLALNPAATVTLPVGSSPSQVLVSARGTLMFGSQLLPTSTMSSYRIKADGSLSLISTVIPPGGTTFLGMSIHPINSGLYVGLPDVNQVGVYEFGVVTGTLSFERTVLNAGTSVCWSKVNAAGTRLYTSETTSNSLSVYDLTDVINPVQLQHFSFRNEGNFGPTNLAIDPTGAFLYVLSGTRLHVLNILADGSVSETLPPVKLPVKTGTIPVGLVSLMK